MVKVDGPEDRDGERNRAVAAGRRQRFRLGGAVHDLRAGVVEVLAFFLERVAVRGDCPREAWRSPSRPETTARATEPNKFSHTITASIIASTGSSRSASARRQRCTAMSTVGRWTV